MSNNSYLPNNWNLPFLKKKEPPKEEDLLFVLFDFEPTTNDSDKLAIAKNDQLILKKEGSENWLYVKSESGKKGYVPANRVARESDRVNVQWISLDMDKERAHNTLGKEKYERGAFIIRPKSSTNGTLPIGTALSLSMRMISNDGQEAVGHFSINRVEGRFSIDAGREFTTLERMINYYSVQHDSTLLQQLKYSVKREKPIEVWEVAEADITKGEKIGDGQFSEVYKGLLYGYQEVALKKLKGAEVGQESVEEEAEFGRRVSHENITRTIGICNDLQMIITEFMPLGALDKYIQKNPLSAAECLAVAVKIANGLVYMEQTNNVHRDIAARNVLIGKNLDIIKLADFGLARRLVEKTYYRSVQGAFSYRWTAPESYIGEGEGKFTTHSDIWSYAVLLWELYSDGAIPYSEKVEVEEKGEEEEKEKKSSCNGTTTTGKIQCWSYREVYRKVVKEGYRLEKPEKMSDQIYQILVSCWNIIPEERPTFVEVHTLLSNMMA